MVGVGMCGLLTVLISCCYSSTWELWLFWWLSIKDSKTVRYWGKEIIANLSRIAHTHTHTPPRLQDTGWYIFPIWDEIWLRHLILKSLFSAFSPSSSSLSLLVVTQQRGCAQVNYNPTDINFALPKELRQEEEGVDFIVWVMHVYRHCCLVAKFCSTLCDPMDCSPPGSSVHRIPQARILKWVAISFSVKHCKSFSYFERLWYPDDQRPVRYCFPFPGVLKHTKSSQMFIDWL